MRKFDSWYSDCMTLRLLSPCSNVCFICFYVVKTYFLVCIWHSNNDYTLACVHTDVGPTFLQKWNRLTKAYKLFWVSTQMRWLLCIWLKLIAFRAYYLGVKSGTWLLTVFIGWTLLGITVSGSFSVVSGGKVSKYYSITVPHCLFRTLLINAEYFSGNVCHAQTI